MSWRRTSALVLPAVSAVSLWLPWVDHKAAALVLTGLDLPDFVRFMGPVSAELARPTLIAFSLPLIAAALTGSGACGVYHWSMWFRVAVLAAGVWLASVTLSPMEMGREFLAVACLIAAVWLLANRRRPSLGAVATFAVVGGTVASAAALWQFARLRPCLAGLYGEVRWGCGPWLAIAVVGCGLALGVSFVFSRAAGSALSARRASRG